MKKSKNRRGANRAPKKAKTKNQTAQAEKINKKRGKGMKKHYLPPALELIAVGATDVIATSNNPYVVDEYGSLSGLISDSFNDELRTNG